MAPLQRNYSSLSPKKSSTIQHPTHQEHPLEEITNETEYSCDGCNTSGVGTRYHCSTCSFDLHEHCAKCPDKLSSYVHPRHVLLLENKASIDRFCDVCGESVNGLFYSCEECEVDIHPLCTLLPLNVSHPIHPQHVLRLQPGKPGWCAVSREICNFWRYRCNTCCIDVHPKCLLTGSSDLASGGGGGGEAIQGGIRPQPQSPRTTRNGHNASDGTPIPGTPQQAPQQYPPAGYPGEVTIGGAVTGTRGLPNSPLSAYPVMEHEVGVRGSGQGVPLPHQAPQTYPPQGYVGEIPTGGTMDTRGGLLPNSLSPALSNPKGGHGAGIFVNGGLVTQGMSYPPPQSYPVAGYGVDVFSGGGGGGGVSTPKGMPHQPAQSYPVAGYGGEVIPRAGGGILQQQGEAQTYSPTGYPFGIAQGGYQMQMMMNPGFPMGMMMMPQPPTMVIYHQNYPGQGGQQQKGVNKGENQKKKNDEFDELAEVGKVVKKKMQLAAKYAMNAAGMASNSKAAAPVNVSTFLK